MVRRPDRPTASCGSAACARRPATRSLHVFYRDGDTLDALVWLGKHRADRAKHAVRLVQFRHGATLHRYLTNVLSPRRLPLAEVARLYARRWDIEMAVNTVKTDLGLHLLVVEPSRR